MGSGLLGTPGSGFYIILCLPVLDLSNLSDVSLFQEHLDRAVLGVRRQHGSLARKGLCGTTRAEATELPAK